MLRESKEKKFFQGKRERFIVFKKINFSSIIRNTRQYTLQYILLWILFKRVMDAFKPTSNSNLENCKFYLKTVFHNMQYTRDDSLFPASNICIFAIMHKATFWVFFMHQKSLFYRQLF